MKVVVAGGGAADLLAALREEGAEVSTVDGQPNRPALEEAGIHEAGAFVLTDVDHATAIPVATDLNEALTVLVYADASLPDFVTGVTDYAIDPDVLTPAAVAEELLGTA